MNIPIINHKLQKKNLLLFRKFSSPDTIIPIGTDCHPAYILNSLYLRKQSFPFDWILIDSVKGIHYVTKNLNDDFRNFISNLAVNERGYIVSKNFPYVEFFHEKKLIESEADKERMMRRASRFKDIVRKNRITFLYGINPENFKTEEDVVFFVNSLKTFSEQFLSSSSLKIFVKIDLNEVESPLINNLISESLKIKGVAFKRYKLDRQKFGIWGDHRDFLPLLRGLGIKVKTQLIPGIKVY